MKYLKHFNESYIEPLWKEIDEAEYDSKYYESLDFSDKNLKSLINGLESHHILSKWDKICDRDTWYQTPKGDKGVNSIRLWTSFLKEGSEKPNKSCFHVSSPDVRKFFGGSKNFGKITQLDDEWFMVEWHGYEFPNTKQLNSEYLLQYHDTQFYICDQMDGLIDFLKSKDKVK